MNQDQKEGKEPQGVELGPVKPACRTSARPRLRPLGRRCCIRCWPTSNLIGDPRNSPASESIQLFDTHDAVIPSEPFSAVHVAVPRRGQLFPMSPGQSRCACSYFSMVPISNT